MGRNRLSGSYGQEEAEPVRQSSIRRCGAGGGEVDADFEYPPAVVGERTGVASLLDLGQGLIRSGVSLDFDDVDVVFGLDEDVYAAVGCRALRFDIFPHQLDDDVHRVLEILLAVGLDLVVCPGEEGVEASHEAFRVAGLDTSIDMREIKVLVESLWTGA